MRLAVTARLAAVFVLSLAAGLGAYLWFGQPTRVVPPAETRATPPPSAGAAPSPARARALPSINEAPTRAGAAVPETGAGPEARPLSRTATRRLLERVVGGKLADRELQPHEYDRLTDSVLRLRSALRILRRSDATANPATLEAQRQIVAASLAEIERITGVPPSDLGEVLAADDDAPPEPSAAETVAPKAPR